MGYVFLSPELIPPMLTDTTCKNAKAKDNPYKLTDEKGMFLLVNPNGSKYFRLKYRIDGKEKLLALGVYPETSLKQARDKREEARQKLADGIDPSESRKAEKIAHAYTFERLIREWLTSNSHTLKTLTHHKKLRRFEIHVLPVLGDMPVNAIKSPDIYNLIKPLIAKNELDTAHRVRSEISAVAYCIAHGLTDYDPVQAVGRQLPPNKVKHRVAIIDPSQFAKLMRDIANYI